MLHVLFSRLAASTPWCWRDPRGHPWVFTMSFCLPERQFVRGRPGRWFSATASGFRPGTTWSSSGGEVFHFFRCYPAARRTYPLRSPEAALLFRTRLTAGLPKGRLSVAYAMPDPYRTISSPACVRTSRIISCLSRFRAAFFAYPGPGRPGWFPATPPGGVRRGFVPEPPELVRRVSTVFTGQAVVYRVMMKVKPFNCRESPGRGRVCRNRSSLFFA